MTIIGNLRAAPLPLEAALGRGGGRGLGLQGEAPFIADRVMLDQTDALRARFGKGAGLEAAVRAETSRERGNVRHFCRWREVERMIDVLAVEEASGTVH